MSVCCLIVTNNSQYVPDQRMWFSHILDSQCAIKEHLYASRKLKYKYSVILIWIHKLRLLWTTSSYVGGGSIGPSAMTSQYFGGATPKKDNVRWMLKLEKGDLFLSTTTL